MHHRLIRTVASCAALLGMAACGGGSGSTPTTPTPPAASGPTMTIDAGGVLSPKELVVSPGTRVRFTNQSSRARQVSSDPHPEHTDCPEINQVGFLASGQTKETGNLNVVRTCGIHDHDDPSNANMRARIVVR
ncbi:hypothetical protein TBR22_A36090 [Luteitalea sp. TBR-22]|uniref:cupredoxin domain-containing protein n=1 Tax=Luteitalea sp. TBR-22 TaxID=2802971 RepID=UPI001AF10537|nr:hypothetical protein [Luteitalea sp. TBR-22]BCS34379.1 hypothetical protein TBR22_A36090 [Luteitalea sp. TBR-22]